VDGSGIRPEDWAEAIRLDRAPGLTDVDAVMSTLVSRAARAQRRTIGFPAATDIDWSRTQRVFTRLFNNVGDPGTAPSGEAHTNSLEVEVVRWFADVVGLPQNDRWGYVTSGGTESNIAALRVARDRFPDAVLYLTHASHYSIRKTANLLGLHPKDVVVVRDSWYGEMDYGHFEKLVARYKGRPAIVVATAGTTLWEAVDQTDRIETILDAYGVMRRHVHVDAALSGIPLALDGTLGLGAGSPIDSIAISGHKFLGTPIPCGVVVMRDSVRVSRGEHISYTATVDSTVLGSRCGQAAVVLWAAIAMYGRNGHQARALRARRVAAYAVERIGSTGWPVFRHPDAFTVVLQTPPLSLAAEFGWVLSVDGDYCHIICMPGVSHEVVDEFVADLGRVVARWAVMAECRTRPQNSGWRAVGAGEDRVLSG
jgi:histidine decarboxylase